jgi:hypothetical protein
VTIVPRTVGAVGTGIGEMLGMGGGQRWGGGSGNGNGSVGTTTPNGNVSTTGWGVGGAAAAGKGGREIDLENDKEVITVFEVGEEDDDNDDDDENETQKGVERDDVPVIVHDPWAKSEKRSSNGCEFPSFFFSFPHLLITSTKKSMIVQLHHHNHNLATRSPPLEPRRQIPQSSAVLALPLSTP